MIQSILYSTKKALGLEPENDDFDEEVIMQINSVFATLHQLGVGPAEGFMIEDETLEWWDFLGDVTPLNNVKNFMFLSVRLAFDPPENSFGIQSVEKQIAEIGWRLEVASNPRPAATNPDLLEEETLL